MPWPGRPDDDLFGDEAGHQSACLLPVAEPERTEHGGDEAADTCESAVLDLDRCLVGRSLGGS